MPSSHRAAENSVRCRKIGPKIALARHTLGAYNSRPLIYIYIRTLEQTKRPTLHTYTLSLVHVASENKHAYSDGGVIDTSRRARASSYTRASGRTEIRL